jgi:hypothetical protein
MGKPKMLVIAAHGGQYGPGKVHYPANYDNVSARSGMTLCGRHVYGETVGEGERPVDCQHCLKRDLRNASGGLVATSGCDTLGSSS